MSLLIGQMLRIDLVNQFLHLFLFFLKSFDFVVFVDHHVLESLNEPLFLLQLGLILFNHFCEVEINVNVGSLCFEDGTLLGLCPREIHCAP